MLSISECPCTDKGTSNGETCNDGGRLTSTKLPRDRLWRISVSSILDLAIVEIIVVTNGILIAVLGVAVGSVIVILDGLESEGEVVHKDVRGFWFGIESGALDGRSSQDIHRAAKLDDSLCVSLPELDTDGVVISNHTVIEVFLQEVSA